MLLPAHAILLNVIVFIAIDSGVKQNQCETFRRLSSSAALATNTGGRTRVARSCPAHSALVGVCG
jgi:hypothetical protein